MDNLYDHVRGAPPGLWGDGHLTVDQCNPAAHGGYDCTGTFWQNGGMVPQVDNATVHAEREYRKADLIAAFHQYDVYGPDPYGPGEIPTHVRLRNEAEWRTVKHGMAGIATTVAGCIMLALTVLLHRLRNGQNLTSTLEF